MVYGESLKIRQIKRRLHMCKSVCLRMEKNGLDHMLNHMVSYINNRWQVVELEKELKKEYESIKNVRECLKAQAYYYHKSH